MNDSELEKRRERALNETLVISQTDGGFRVYNPAAITHLYMVSGIPESPKCTCPDFESHQSDPEWRCKHILAVLNQIEKKRSQPGSENSGVAEPKEPVQAESQPVEKKKSRPPRNGASQMVIKRSVSPDGYINSLSVEFSSVIGSGSQDEIKQQAQKALLLQEEIVVEFLRGKENGKSNAQATEKTADNGGAKAANQDVTNQSSNNSDGAVLAQLLNVAGMNTSGGWKLFINVQVNGRLTKLFGSKREIGDYIAAAGFASIAEHIDQGTMLNLPCRVITKPSANGKYLNIERVFPLKPLQTQGRERP